MVANRTLVLLALVWASSARGGPTPLEKVVSLLEGLKADIEAEGTSAASNYDKFACFCKDTTESKTSAIQDGNDKVDTLSADIEEKEATKAEKETELDERKKKQEELTAELEVETVRCKKEATKYEISAADMSKAISSLSKAKESLGNAQPAALVALRSSIQKTLVLADTLSMLSATKSRTVGSFMQQGVDPDSPEYKFHSQNILDILGDLHTEFTDKKKELDDEWDKTKKACDELKASLNEQLTENKSNMDQLDIDISDLTEGIAADREELMNTETVLKDDQTYLKDLTMRCEAKAKLWDQRTQMRAGELKALSGALEILNDKVAAADAAANKRALLLQHAGLRVAKASVSFLQATTVVSRAQRVQTERSTTASSNTFPGKNQAIVFLNGKGRELESDMLFSVAKRMAADPFTKVKKLIQGLIERLLTEAKNEATKKGFCDTQLGKLHHDRDSRLADIKNLNAELGALEASRDKLDLEITELTDALTKLRSDLDEATTLRGTEKEENTETIAKANEGLKAVTEAITILKTFYKDAAKATGLMQASPVDEDPKNPGAGFDGEYAGKQGASTGIIGLLEIIRDDFDRTDRQTTAQEKKNLAEFVKFERTSKTDISGKDTKKELDEQELSATKDSIEKKMKDLKTASGLLDDALKAVEELKPMCIDTGMSYADRVAKREEEIQALNDALTLLAPP